MKFDEIECKYVIQGIRQSNQPSTAAAPVMQMQ